MGAGWVAYRTWYAAQRRLGLLRVTMPVGAWEGLPLRKYLRRGVPDNPAEYGEWRRQNQPAFFFESVDAAVLSGFGDASIAEANAILGGTQLYFRHQAVSIGFPPDWHRNPMSDMHAPADQHWSRISETAFGDIKMIWEPSRFASAYTLSRAWARTRDERYAEGFWAMVVDWKRCNPPNQSANWMSGQEAAVRLMAWCFALYAMADADATTPERLGMLTLLVATHAERIEGNLEYARSQKNNHGISEALGLWMVGLLFPELERARHWREWGKRVLEEEALRQIYDDGSYVQHSLNYHRMMLQLLTWGIRLGEMHADPLSPAVLTRFHTAVKYLAQMLDPHTGKAPNSGHNDGSLILPLSDCDYVDYRPATQAAFYCVAKESLWPRGRWDEEGYWIFGRELVDTKQQREGKSAVAVGAGGNHILRGNDSWAILRCAHYVDRPAHADQLHFDLWWRGENVVCDAGTYLYNGREPWGNQLSQAAVHNTVTIDGKSQMLRAGKFLWLDWAQGVITRRERGENYELIEAQHDGYHNVGVLHRRAVLIVRPEIWVVVDDVLGRAQHDARLQWLVADAPWNSNGLGDIQLQCAAGTLRVQTWCSSVCRRDLIRGGGVLMAEPSSQDIDPWSSIRGWRSLYYGGREPALSLSVAARANCPIRFLTVCVLGDHSLVQHCDAEALVVRDRHGQSAVHVSFERVGASKIIGAIENTLLRQN